MARTSAMTGGTNSFQTTSEDINKVRTNFFTDGPVGAITNTSGVAPMTGVGAVNAQSTPNMTVQLTGGDFLVTATPTSQASQRFNVTMDANSSYTINSNTSGGTRYDYIYVSLSAALLANPDVNGSTVGTWYTSRSTSNTTDNGTPPTYGYCVAVVTVTNNATSISNGNITDSRAQSGVSALGANVTSNGSLNPSVLKDSSNRIHDYVSSGGVITFTASTLNWSMTGGVCYIGGQRYTFSAASGTVTASKDTYFDLQANANGTASLINSGGNIVANNAASPALAASSVRIGIVVSGTSISSINQGSVGATAPTVSSCVLTVTDSNGIMIYPTSPAVAGTLVGFRSLGSYSTASTTYAGNVAGLTTPVFLPSTSMPRNAEITVTFHDLTVTGTNANPFMILYDGTVGVGTALREVQGYSSVSGAQSGVTTLTGYVNIPSNTTKSFNIGVKTSAGTVVVNGPIIVAVKLV